MNLEKFGNPKRFEIAIAWSNTQEDRSKLPKNGGWSAGRLQITVNDYVLTQHRRLDESVDFIEWYLFPVFEWFIKNWKFIFHEEKFSWQENRQNTAAVTVFHAMKETIASDLQEERDRFNEIQNWWQRHALRAADSSALYPDIYFRRLNDEIEISWTERAPVYAPDGFGFSLKPGSANLSVLEVAEPIWSAISWSLSEAGGFNLGFDDGNAISELLQSMESLKRLPVDSFEKTYLSKGLVSRISSSITEFFGKSALSSTAPVLPIFDSPVLMFGGVSPDINVSDICTLVRLLEEQSHGKDSECLSRFIDSDVGVPIDSPYSEGYDLAEDCLDELGLYNEESEFVDIENILKERFNIAVKIVGFDTDSIRGVAIAGDEYSPCIILNSKSQFNSTSAGRRFTLAHELCHILYDRSRARKVSHVSGPWAARGVEKRANAFAAMFLMPKPLLRKMLSERYLDLSRVAEVSRAMSVNKLPLIEHAYNLNIISFEQREALKLQLDTTEKE